MDGLAAIANIAGELFGAVLRVVRLLWPIKLCTLADGEKGFITYCGKYLREIGPGINWTTALCDFQYCQAVGCYADLAEQGLQTSDGTACIVNGSVVYEIHDSRAALMLTDDVETIVQSACMEGIRRHARANPFDSIQDSANVTAKIRGNVNRMLKDYGVKVKTVMIADLHPTDVQVAADAVDRILQRNLLDK